MATECLDEFEYNYLSVVLERVPFDVKEKQTKLEDMLEKDPLGLVTIPTDNPLCWTLHRTAPTAGSTELRSAVWHWVYERKGGKQRYKLAREDRPNHQLVGDVDSLPIGQSLIILPNVGLDEHMRMTKSSRNILREFPEKHHVHGVTWDRSARKRKR